MERINTLRAKYLVDHGINLKGARPHRLKVDARIYAYSGTSKLEVSTIDDEIALDDGVEDNQ